MVKNFRIVDTYGNTSHEIYMPSNIYGYHNIVQNILQWVAFPVFILISGVWLYHPLRHSAYNTTIYVNYLHERYSVECQANTTQFVHQSQALSSEAAFAYPNKHSLEDDSQAKSLKIEAALLKSGFISLRL